MSLIASLLGGVGGIVSGIMPEVVSYFKAKQQMKVDRQDHEMELERLQFSLDSEVKMLGIKQEMAYNERSWDASIKEDDNYTARISDITSLQRDLDKDLPLWVKVWNGVLRPTFITVNIALFTIAAMLQVYLVSIGISDWSDISQLKLAGELFWANEMISGSISGTISFLIGYRSARKLPLRTNA
jgi:hypothetical protein